MNADRSVFTVHVVCGTNCIASLPQLLILSESLQSITLCLDRQAWHNLKYFNVLLSMFTNQVALRGVTECTDVP